VSIMFALIISPPVRVGERPQFSLRSPIRGAKPHCTRARWALEYHVVNERKRQESPSLCSSSHKSEVGFKRSGTAGTAAEEEENQLCCWLVGGSESGLLFPYNQTETQRRQHLVVCAMSVSRSFVPAP